ncbi:hypothetical protein [Lysobacter gummosus]|uniref:hypothetical protein n=1 Tax=Lysobacter gummosus TaxID=262324 RepID=UPI00363371AC
MESRRFRRCSLPSVAKLDRLRIARPGHPWPGVRGRGRCRQGIGQARPLTRAVVGSLA